MFIDDDILRECHSRYSIRIFVPVQTMVVMARSNPVSDCHVEACTREGIAVLRRLGGGGAVVLYDGCVVISVGAWMDRDFDNAFFFKCFNRLLIRFFHRRYAIESLQERGVSDLALGDRKCVGSSLFRSGRYLLYQASCLVDVDMELMERCLSHPKREPGYRQLRSHRQFVVGLNTVGVDSAQKLCEDLQCEYERLFCEVFAGILRDPDGKRIPFLRRRIGAAKGEN